MMFTFHRSDFRFAIWFVVAALTPPTLAVTVQNLLPSHGSAPVYREGSIVVSFDDRVDDATIHDSSFAVRGTGNYRYDGTLTARNNTLTWSNAVPFSAGERIQVMIDTGLFSGTISLEAPHMFSFYTHTTACDQGMITTESAPGSNNGVSSLLVDLNRDGDLDWVTGRSSSNGLSTVEVYENDGAGAFSLAQQLGTNGCELLTSGDFDGDGFPDLATGQIGQSQVTVYRNTGDGSLITNQVITVPGALYGLGLYDSDFDGELELVVNNLGGTSYISIYETDAGNLFAFATNRPAALFLNMEVDDANNDGLPDQLQWAAPGAIGAFPLMPFDQPLPAHHLLGDAPRIIWNARMADLNQDGWMDIVTTAIRAPVTAYLSQGPDFFTTNVLESSQSDTALVVQVGDLNGNGDLDLAVSRMGERSSLYYQQTDGSFDQRDFGDIQLTRAMSLGDLDGDGDLDIIETGEDENMPNRIHFQSCLNATTLYPDREALNAPSNFVMRLTFSADLDPASLTSNLLQLAGSQSGPVSGVLSIENGNQLVFTPTQPLFPGEFITTTLLPGLRDLNGDQGPNGAYGFTIAAQGCAPSTWAPFPSIASNKTLSVQLADINHDGHLDLIQANAQSPCFVYTGLGNGSFTNPVAIGTGSFTREIGVGDLNQDGHLDLILVDDLIPPSIYHGIGDGTFSSAGNLGTNLMRDLIVADLNTDAVPDVVLAATNGTNSVYLNDGAGNLVWSSNLVVSGAVNAVLLNPARERSTPDLVFLADTNIFFFRNSGTGEFTSEPTTNLPTGVSFQDATVGDLNGNQQLNFALATDGNDVVIFNDSSIFLTSTNLTTEIALGDYDGDGDLDLFASRDGSDGAGATNAVYTNPGNGLFSSSTNTPLGAGRSQGIALGDLDGDGDLDVVIAQAFAPCDVWENLSCDDAGDSDMDGIPNSVELLDSGLDPLNPADANSDLDLDNQTVLQEYIAGTSWNDGNSYFHLDQFEAGDLAELRFEANPGRVYSVDGQQGGGTNWVPILESIPYTNAMMSVTITNLLDTRWYRLRVRLP